MLKIQKIGKHGINYHRLVVQLLVLRISRPMLKNVFIPMLKNFPPKEGSIAHMNKKYALPYNCHYE